MRARFENALKQAGAALALLLLMILSGCASAPIEPEPDVRVLIVDGIPELRLVADGEWFLNWGESETSSLPVPEADGTYVLTAKDGAVKLSGMDGWAGANPLTLVSDFSTSHTMTIKNVPYGTGWWFAGKEDRRYQGSMNVYATPQDTLQVVVTLPAEEYLRGVVPSEIGGKGTPLEAQKAQAIAARSELMMALKEKKYVGPFWDICADVNCQVYSGLNKHNEGTDEAIRATRGEVLIFKGEPIGAYYASNSGGYSENVENVWPSRSGAVPYWSGNFDGPGKGPGPIDSDEKARAWIASSPEVYSNPAWVKGGPSWSTKSFRWVREFTAEELSEAIAVKAKKDMGRVLALKSVRRGVSGRIIELDMMCERGVFQIKDQLEIRQLVKSPLRSSCFVVDTEGPADRPTKFILRGAGYGHGVGMDQTGAIGRALKGQKAAEILAAYYRKSKLERMW